MNPSAPRCAPRSCACSSPRNRPPARRLPHRLQLLRTPRGAVGRGDRRGARTSPKPRCRLSSCFRAKGLVREAMAERDRCRLRGRVRLRRHRCDGMVAAVMTRIAALSVGLSFASAAVLRRALVFYADLQRAERRRAADGHDPHFRESFAASRRASAASRREHSASAGSPRQPRQAEHGQPVVGRSPYVRLCNGREDRENADRAARSSCREAQPCPHQ